MGGRRWAVSVEVDESRSWIVGPTHIQYRMATLRWTFILQRCILLEEAFKDVEVPTQIPVVVVFFTRFTSRPSSPCSKSYHFACVCLAPSRRASIQLQQSQGIGHLARISRRQARRYRLHAPRPRRSTCVTRRMFPHRTSYTVDTPFCALWWIHEDPRYPAIVLDDGIREVSTHSHCFFLKS